MDTTVNTSVANMEQVESAESLLAAEAENDDISDSDSAKTADAETMADSDPDNLGEEDDDTVQTYSYEKKRTKEIVSDIAYLIGVKKSIFENEHEPMQLENYEKLEKNTHAKIIRELCRLRTAIEQNYKYIHTKMVHDFCTLMRMPEYVPVDAIMFLANENIIIVKPKFRQPTDYIMEINRQICDRINNCRELFPIWLNWQYVRDLFIMPDGLTLQGTKASAELFYANKQKYPYQVYINWKPDDHGNILFHDKKFLTLLYQQHDDVFSDISRVTDADDEVKGNIYEFLGSSNRAVLVVDCENCDPYKLIATIGNLDRDQLDKIAKIILYNDCHASSAWGMFEYYAKNITVEHIMTVRVKEEKSLVDIKLTTGVCKEFYANQVDSFIIASSDSDYWGLIESLPEARFLVMLEWEKCGPDIKNALKSRNIFYCYIDDFCTGNTNDFKLSALVMETKKYLSERIQLNVNEMLADVYRTTRVHMTEAEQTQFYNKYIKPMHFVIAPDGNVTVELRSK